MNAVAFADSSSQLLFSGSDDAVCKVWDRRMLQEDRPQPVGQLAGHRDGITFIHSKVEKRCCWHFIWIWLKMINYKPKLATVHSFRVQPNSLRGSQVQFVSFFSFFSKIWFLCVCVCFHWAREMHAIWSATQRTSPSNSGTSENSHPRKAWQPHVWLSHIKTGITAGSRFHQKVRKEGIKMSSIWSIHVRNYYGFAL